MAQSPILVTGASGNLGRRVVELLIERGAGPVVATTRDPAKLADLAARGVDVRKADFDDASSLEAAFAGAGRAVLVSTDALDRPGRRIEQHATAIRAFEKAGVKHVVYTSLPNAAGIDFSIARDHAATEAALEASALDFTILRNNLYLDLLTYSLPGAIAAGELVDAKGDGRTAWVSRDDCARAAAGAVIEVASGRHTFDVTGPEALSSADIAAIASELSGKPVVHVQVGFDEVVAGLVSHGLPAAMAEVYAGFDLVVADGKLATVTDTVQRLGGKAPRSARAFLAAALRPVAQ